MVSVGIGRLVCTVLGTLAGDFFQKVRDNNQTVTVITVIVNDYRYIITVITRAHRAHYPHANGIKPLLKRSFSHSHSSPVLQ